ncbi:MAG: hypothetical protein ACFFAJ_12865 [Candidatus Hodarchaeota archaeon]
MAKITTEKSKKKEILIKGEIIGEPLPTASGSTGSPPCVVYGT